MTTTTIKTVGLWITDLHLHLNNVHQFESTIKQAIAYCVKNGVNTIFNGGDTFTSRKGQPQEVLKVFRESLEQLKANNITMYAIVGNHDKTDYSSKDSFLIAFQDHEALMLVEEYDNVDIVVGLRVHMVSFFEDGMFREKLGLTKTDILDDMTNICLTHIGIDGAKMNSGLALSANITAKDFREFDHVYVGHYHNYQKLNDKITYTGSTFPHNFGEDNNKGMWLLRSDGTMECIKTEFESFHTIEEEEVDVEGMLMRKVEGCHLRVKTSKISTMDRARLEQAGIKVQIEKKGLIMTMDKETMQTFDDSSLVDAYNEWAVKKKLPQLDKERGLAMLKKAL